MSLREYDRAFLSIVKAIKLFAALGRDDIVDALDEVRVQAIHEAPGGWSVEDVLGVDTE